MPGVTKAAVLERVAPVRALGLFESLQRRLDVLTGAGRDLAAFQVCLPDGEVKTFGKGDVLFTVRIKNAAGAAALASFDELNFVEAYFRGDLDLVGDPLDYLTYRDVLSDRRPLRYLWSSYVRPRLFGQVKSDKEGIKSHYDIEADFFVLWLDRSVRGYSHAFFERDDEALEPAMERKIQYAIDAVGARPGDRVLDIGGGWGSLLQYGGERGLRITSLTISGASERYMRELIARKHLADCTVVNEHLLEYRPGERFDAIINLGVTEHLPDYAGTIAQYERLLKPGGKIYLDAYSGSRLGMSSFVTKWVFEGNTSPWCLHEYLKVLSATGFEIQLLQNDRHNYYLTCRKWAENLDRVRDEVVRRWGEALYRRFRLYLWGSAYAFLEGTLDAHRMVLLLPKDQLGRQLQRRGGKRDRLV